MARSVALIVESDRLDQGFSCRVARNGGVPVDACDDVRRGGQRSRRNAMLFLFDIPATRKLACETIRESHGSGATRANRRKCRRMYLPQWAIVMRARPRASFPGWRRCL